MLRLLLLIRTHLCNSGWSADYLWIIVEEFGIFLGHVISIDVVHRAGADAFESAGELG